MSTVVVGAGRIGRVHAAALRAIDPRARVVFCDTDADRLRAAADGGGRTYTDLDDCVASERPAAVHVCTPPATHAAVAARALDAGAAVLIEKPMALDRAGAATIGARLRTRPGAVCVDHNFLFDPCVLAARGWVEEGRVGRVLAADVFYGVEQLPGDAGPGAWAGALPGGRFTDVLPHAVYLAREFVGDVVGIAAGDARVRGVGSELGVVLSCTRGLASVRVSLSSIPWELSLVLRGDEGTARVDLARQRAVLMRRPRLGGRRLGQVVMAAAAGAQMVLGVADRVAGKLSGRLRGYPGMRALIAGFHASLRDGTPPPVTFADGAAVAAVLEDVRAHLGSFAREAA